MAGCIPLHFPIVIAAIKCMLSSPFNLHGLHATTMGATPCVVVNGPQSLTLNSSHGALGSGTRGNATIGRALKLVLLNVGGGVLGGSESTTLGSPMKFTMCVAENEAKCATSGWEPLHVTRGFQLEETVVTLIPVTSGPVQIVDFFARDADTLIALIADSLSSAYSRDMPLINDVTVVIPPEHIDTLVKGGIRSKEEMALRLFNACNSNLAASYGAIVRNKVVVDNKVPAMAAPLLGAVLGGTLGVVQWLVTAGEASERRKESSKEGATGEE